jgi:hypothetical protein
MDTYFEEGAEPPQPRPREEIPAFPFPIEPIDISLARWQVASRIGKLPFDGYEACTRSLWLVFAGDWGVWVRAVIPVDNRLDAQDRVTLVATRRRLARSLASGPGAVRAGAITGTGEPQAGGSVGLCRKGRVVRNRALMAPEFGQLVNDMATRWTVLVIEFECY